MKNQLKIIFLATISVIDISGFTSLSSRLAARGNDGIEDLMNHLTIYFGKLIEVVYKYNGDIIAFAGDALIIMWIVEESTDQDQHLEFMKTSILLSVSCGLEIQKTLAEYDSNPQELDKSKKDILTIHIATGFGNCSGMNVGGLDGHWFWQVSGKPLEQISRIDSYSKSGDLVISREAWFLIKDISYSILLDEKDGAIKIHNCFSNHNLPNSPALDISQLNNSALISYTNPSVVYNIYNSKSSKTGEIKVVTVMFISCQSVLPLYGIYTLQNYLMIVQAVAKQLRGVINKVLIDEKGTTIILVFGLPPHGVHPDDPSRACQAAIAIKHRLENLTKISQEKNLPNYSYLSSIGLATGRIFCGVYGMTGTRMEYVILGSKVNLAARLMCFAKSSNNILVDKMTYESAKEEIKFEIWPSIVLKGLMDPVPVFRPLSHINHSQNFNSLLKDHFMSGRESIKTLFASKLLGISKDPHSSCIFIDGDSKFGKTNTSIELLSQCSGSIIENYYTLAPSNSLSSPFVLFNNLIKNLYHFSYYSNKIDGLDSIKNYFYKKFQKDPSIIDSLPLLNDFVTLHQNPIDFLDSAFVNSITNIDTRNSLTVDLLIKLISSVVGSNPTCFVFDDSHYISSFGFEILYSLIKNLTTCLFLFTFSSSNENYNYKVDEFIQKLTKDNVCAIDKFVLDPLDTNDILKIVKHICKVNPDSVSQDLLDLILIKSGGCPLFVIELINNMMKPRNIQDSELSAAFVMNDCLVVRDIDYINLMETSKFENIIISRIDKFSLLEKIIIQIASCLTDRFFAFQIYDIILLSKDEILDVTENMVADSLANLKEDLGLEYDEEDKTYSFTKKFTKTIIYNNMLQIDRKKYHSMIATWYKNYYKSNIGEFYDIISFHLERCDQEDVALEYKILDAKYCFKNFAYNKVILNLRDLDNFITKHNLKYDHHDLLDNMASLSYFHSGYFDEFKPLTVKVINKQLDGFFKSRKSFKKYKISYGKDNINSSYEFFYLLIIYLHYSFLALDSLDTLSIYLHNLYSYFKSFKSIPDLYVSVHRFFVSHLKLESDSSLDLNVLTNSYNETELQSILSILWYHKSLYDFYSCQYKNISKDFSTYLLLSNQVGDISTKVFYYARMGYFYLWVGNFEEFNNTIKSLEDIHSSYKDLTSQFFLTIFNFRFLMLTKGFSEDNTNYDKLFDYVNVCLLFKIISTATYCHILYYISDSKDKVQYLETGISLISGQAFIPPILLDSIYLLVDCSHLELIREKRNESLFKKITKLNNHLIIKGGKSTIIQCIYPCLNNIIEFFNNNAKSLSKFLYKNLGALQKSPFKFLYACIILDNIITIKLSAIKYNYLNTLIEDLKSIYQSLNVTFYLEYKCKMYGLVI